ncbi:hypothetical protein [Actinotignum urinale]|uniref:Uncharacterized protein n=1 Tax=Actinotignum urinale TaxID=190146 RepID=A0ABU5G7W5_9ACTO|nr:hypothetical protein [Actinotignum urinale]MDY5133425.1 hypothetical protein [Actinotignum urinale]
MSKESDTQAKWGYVRGTKVSALKVASMIGPVIAVGLGAVRVFTNPPGPYKWVAVLIYAACLCAPAIGFVWVIIVDRTTLPGATKHPEQTVETHWHKQAATNAFLATVCACGIGVLFSDGVISKVLAGVLVFEFVSYSIAYLWAKTR